MKNTLYFLSFLFCFLFSFSIISAQDDVIMYVAVDEKPKFQGGEANVFSKWVVKNMVYPEYAIENGIQGRVTVQFVVNEDGSVSNVKVLNGLDKLLDAEAVRVVSKSPKWSPGKQAGVPVKVKYVFPVVFRFIK